MHIFELMLGYTWWAICHTVNKDSCMYRSIHAAFFEHPLTRAHGGTTVTRVLTRNVLANIFEQ